MKIGDLVRVIGVPERLSLDDETRAVFERSVGGVFPIIDITDEGLIELEVGTTVGVAPYLHSIWLELKYVEPAKNSN